MEHFVWDINPEIFTCYFSNSVFWVCKFLRNSEVILAISQPATIQRLRLSLLIR